MSITQNEALTEGWPHLSSGTGASTLLARGSEHGWQNLGKWHSTFCANAARGVKGDLSHQSVVLSNVGVFED